ncbi:MAG: 3-deoxy-7-phosphoheptulonate synthase [Parachlamydiales bacterium]|jgi:3-deoxy-7-phosphoheptulonate synthase
MPVIQPLPSPAAIKTLLPAHGHISQFIQNTRQQIRRILQGEDPRWIVIVGPCSIHDITAGLQFATKLRELAQKTSETLFIVMRTYYEKSRTAGGWKGLLYDPNLDGTQDIEEGIKQTRKFLLDIAQKGIPTAAELLDPLTVPYLEDLISWSCIGARTSTSQTHRQLASSVDFPIGIKNSTDGSIDNAINGAVSASLPHRLLGINAEGLVSTITSRGNPASHVVLRGSENGTNFDKASLEITAQKLEKTNLVKRFVVDCSHGNSQRNPQKQKHVLNSLLETAEEGFSSVCGIILESHLKQGQQLLQAEAPLSYGVSVTDSCLGWEETEAMLLEMHERLLTHTLSKRSCLAQ